MAAKEEAEKKRPLLMVKAMTKNDQKELLKSEIPTGCAIVALAVVVGCVETVEQNLACVRIVNVDSEGRFKYLVRTAAGEVERACPARLLRRLPQFKKLDGSAHASMVMKEFLKLEAWDG